jgi:hypothetical protein
MNNKYTAPEISIDLLCERLIFSRLPGPKLHIESTTLTAECPAKTSSKTCEEDFDLFDDTKEGATIEHSRADPRKVCQEVARSLGNSEPITLKVSVKIKDRPLPETATFAVRFAGGKLEKAEPAQNSD